MISMQTPFNWIEENGEAFIQFHASSQKMHVGVSWDAGATLPTNYSLLTGNCGNTTVVETGDLVETEDNIWFFSFDSLLQGVDYYFKFEGEPGSNYELIGNLTEIVRPPSTCFVQTCNFVQNWSFEDFDLAFPLPIGGEVVKNFPKAANSVAFIDEACGWERSHSNGGCSPDYWVYPQSSVYSTLSPQQTCPPNSPNANGNFCTNASHSGDAVAHLFTIDRRPNIAIPDRREYIFSRLNNNLQDGHIYVFDMYTRHTANRATKSSALQVWFQNGFNKISGNNHIISANPQVDFSNDIDMSNPNWQHLMHIFEFTSQTPANTIMLGNFLDNQTTENNFVQEDWTPVTMADHIPALSLDDLRLIELPNAGQDQVICSPSDPIAPLGNMAGCLNPPYNLTTTWYNSANQVVSTNIPFTPNITTSGIYKFRLELNYNGQIFNDYVDVYVGSTIFASNDTYVNCNTNSTASYYVNGVSAQATITPTSTTMTWSAFNINNGNVTVTNPQVTAANGIGQIDVAVAYTYAGMPCTQLVKLYYYECCQNIKGQFVLLPDQSNISNHLSGLSNPITNATFAVYGSVHIDDSFNFDNCEFYLMPDAELIIDAGYAIRFTKCQFKACGPFRWDKINHAFPSSHVTFTQCTVQDALRGIYSVNDAQLDLVANIFKYNSIAQSAINYNQAQANLTWQNKNSYQLSNLTNNSAQHPNSTINLTPVNGSQLPCGIYLESVTDLDMTTNVFITDHYTQENLQLLAKWSDGRIYNNTFFEGRNVDVSNCDFAIDKNSFQKSNPHAQNYPTGINGIYNAVNIYQNTFLDGARILLKDPVSSEIDNNTFVNPQSVVASIQIEGTDYYNPITQSRNRIINNTIKSLWGIKLNNITSNAPNQNTAPNKGVFVTGNTITADYSFNMPNNNTYVFGISADNCNAVSIGQNTIEFMYSGGTMPNDSRHNQTAGIWLSECKNAFVGCNDIYYAARGLFMQGDLTADAWLTYPTYPPQFQSNKFYNCYYGIYLNLQTEIKQFGDPLLASDNQWLTGINPPFTPSPDRVKDMRTNPQNPTYYYFTGSSNLGNNKYPILQYSNFLQVPLSSQHINESCTTAPPPSNKMGSNEPEKGFDLKVYPSPVQDQLVIELYGLNSEPAEIKILSVSGTRMKSESIFGTRAAIDVSHLPSGIYIIHVTTSAATSSKRFVKI